MRYRGALAPALVGLLLAGCAARADEPPAAAQARTADGAAPGRKGQTAVAGDLQAVVQAALADAARRAGPGAVPRVLDAAKVTWRDGSLGCPMPGNVYTMALVPGYRIRIESGAEVLDYHASERGAPFLCPPGRATDPASGTSVY
jgi:hypothetical protein